MIVLHMDEWLAILTELPNVLDLFKLRKAEET